MPFLFLLLLLGGVLAAPGLVRERSWKVGTDVQAAMDRGEEPDNEIVEVSILRLKNARYRRGRPLPEWVQELDGKKISLWGYMAIGTLEGLSEFRARKPRIHQANRLVMEIFVRIPVMAKEILDGRCTPPRHAVGAEEQIRAIPIAA